MAVGDHAGHVPTANCVGVPEKLRMKMSFWPPTFRVNATLPSEPMVGLVSLAPVGENSEVSPRPSAQAEKICACPARRVKTTSLPSGVQAGSLSTPPAPGLLERPTMVDPERQLSYKDAFNPMPRDYQAGIAIEPASDGGTSIHWHGVYSTLWGLGWYVRPCLQR
jgi:hypothetical protein